MLSDLADPSCVPTPFNQPVESFRGDEILGDSPLQWRIWLGDGSVQAFGQITQGHKRCKAQWFLQEFGRFVFTAEYLLPRDTDYAWGLGEKPARARLILDADRSAYQLFVRLEAVDAVALADRDVLCGCAWMCWLRGKLLPWGAHMRPRKLQ